MQKDNNPYTEDLADFGFCEIDMLIDLFTAVTKHGVPDNFYQKGVKPAFNRNSGNVFLVNEEYQVAMLNGDKLEIFHSTPYHEHEGFLSDLVEKLSPNDLHPEDVKYILDAAELEGLYLPPPCQCHKIDRILEQAEE